MYNVGVEIVKVSLESAGRKMDGHGVRVIQNITNGGKENVP